MEPGLESKIELRRQARMRRDLIPAKEREAAGRRILEHLCALPDYPAVDKIFMYCGFGSEPDTLAWAERFRKDGKITAFPRTYPGGRMIYARADEDSQLVPGRFGIPEPDASCEVLEPGPGDWVLVPALLFDRDGYRIGYGSGCFDRYLADYPDCRTIGATFEIARSAVPLPREATDIPVGLFVTEKEEL
ncbi:MAG: 5-formyltetrahydrofolate cyclo-ligase [Firmicutes bacterium]|nr:5-formyltetrahydrofolate cyclo-ligase [Bacillota bacterium]